MKIIIIALGFILTHSVSFSQDALENKLLEVYSKEHTNSILGDFQQKKYYNNIVFNSYSLKKLAPNKIQKQNFITLNSLELKNIDGTTTSITPKATIESINNGTFNILKLNLERDFSETKVYLLGNTNYILKISSYNRLSKLQKQ